MEKKLILIACIFIVICGCLKKYESMENNNVTADTLNLEKIEYANPYHDLEKNLKNNDYRFIAVYGRGIRLPGIPESMRDFCKKYGYRIIHGTSDVILDYEKGRLMAIANYYAENYNEMLLIHLLKENENNTEKSD